jgi:hypothetical protein
VFLLCPLCSHPFNIGALDYDTVRFLVDELQIPILASLALRTAAMSDAVCPSLSQPVELKENVPTMRAFSFISVPLRWRFSFDIIAASNNLTGGPPEDVVPYSTGFAEGQSMGDLMSQGLRLVGIIADLEQVSREGDMCLCPVRLPDTALTIPALDSRANGDRDSEAFREMQLAEPFDLLFCLFECHLCPPISGNEVCGAAYAHCSFNSSICQDLKV